MMSLLDEIYVAQRERYEHDIIRMSGPLIDELWLLVALAPLAVSDLRAKSTGKFYLTDASEDAKAAVVSDLPIAFAKELHRHSLSRGAWSRLLSPWKSWCHSHFELEEDQELPGGVPLVSHPLWTKLARVLKFRLRHRKVVNTRKHINLLELESLLELEAKLTKRDQDFRCLCGAESQVVLAAILKGRSGSYEINKRLQQSLPTMLSGGAYGSYGYVPSLANVGDNPTRCAAVREPLETMPG